MLEGWNIAWENGLWAAPWSRVLEGLTAQHATWKPAAGRHSLWQIVHHLFFWRDVTLRRVRGEPRPDDAEIQRRNWQEMVQTLRTADREVERFFYHLFHDNYHIGQIMQLRAMQGFAPIE